MSLNQRSRNTATNLSARMCIRNLAFWTRAGKLSEIQCPIRMSVADSELLVQKMNRGGIMVEGIRSHDTFYYA
jgi:hypothetical protein